MVVQKEFKVNEYISLKLEGDRTFIYIKDEKYIQCMRLVLQIPKENIGDYDGINSIDEASEIYKTLHGNKILEGGGTHSITPEQEFWGHCSNIQTWVETEYDTRLLHSNLSLPLLKKLVDVGDIIAKRNFKEEIAARIDSGHSITILNIIEMGYLRFLELEELKSINPLFLIFKENFSIYDIKKEDYGLIYEFYSKFDQNVKQIIREHLEDITWNVIVDANCYDKEKYVELIGELGDISLLKNFSYSLEDTLDLDISIFFDLFSQANPSQIKTLTKLFVYTLIEAIQEDHYLNTESNKLFKGKLAYIHLLLDCFEDLFTDITTGRYSLDSKQKLEQFIMYFEMILILNEFMVIIIDDLADRKTPRYGGFYQDSRDFDGGFAFRGHYFEYLMEDQVKVEIKDKRMNITLDQWVSEELDNRVDKFNEKTTTFELNQSKVLGKIIV